MANRRIGRRRADDAASASRRAKVEVRRLVSPVLAKLDLDLGGSGCFSVTMSIGNFVHTSQPSKQPKSRLDSFTSSACRWSAESGDETARSLQSTAGP